MLGSIWIQRAWLRRATVERTISILSPLILLTVWQIGTAVVKPGVPASELARPEAHLIDARFFPAPTTIFLALGDMLQSGELWGHVLATLGRVAIGFAIGAGLGVVLGLAMGLWPLVRAALQPLVDATFPIPKIAILPLYIMIFGIGEESKYAIIATAVVFLVLINTASGVRNIDQIYLDVGKNFHASRRMMFTDIAFPGALPSILTGLKLGMGVALLVIVSAEFIAARSGTGYLIWSSWQVFQVEKMYVGLIVIAVFGFAGAILLDWLERVLIPWKRH